MMEKIIISRRKFLGILGEFALALGFTTNCGPSKKKDLDKIVREEERKSAESSIPERDDLFDLLVKTPGTTYYQKTEGGSNLGVVNLLKPTFAIDYGKLKEDIVTNIDIPRLQDKPLPIERQMVDYAQRITDKLRPGANIKEELVQILYFTAARNYKYYSNSKDPRDLILFYAMKNVARQFAEDYGLNEYAKSMEKKLRFDYLEKTLPKIKKEKKLVNPIV